MNSFRITITDHHSDGGADKFGHGIGNFLRFGHVNMVSTAEKTDDSIGRSIIACSVREQLAPRYVAYTLLERRRRRLAAEK